MKIKAIQMIRYQGVEHKPGKVFEVPDLFGNSFIKRDMAEPAPVQKKKVKLKVE